MENLSNKETANLLALSSESDSDISDLVRPAKKKKVKRRHRLNSTFKVQSSHTCGCKRSDLRVVSLWLAAILIVFSLIALSWLVAVLYGEIRRMDTSIKSGNILKFV